MPTPKDPRGWRVLCIDGGGTRGIVPLTVLKSLAATTKKEPWELFDLIVGTSTGGILAVLLGLLKVPLEECVGIYKDLGEKIFEPGIFNKVKGMAFEGARYSAENFESHVKKILEDTTNNADIKLSELGQEDGVRPCVALVANRDGFDPPYCFTNFESNDDGNTLTNDVCVWEAIRATSAAPTFFQAAKIRVPYVGEVTFTDGGIKHNNPIDVARTLLTRPPFKGTEPSLFVSLGTGMNLFSLGDHANLKQTALTIEKAATNCETAHGHAWPQLKDKKIPYFRFNPEDGLGDLPMDSTEHAERLTNATQNYLTKEHVRNSREQLVGILDAQRLRIVYNEELKEQLSTRMDYSSIFVELYLQDESIELKNIRRRVNIAKKNPTRQVVLNDLVKGKDVCGSGVTFIVGDAGSGKSILLLQLALESTKEEGKEVPVWIELRQQKNPITSIEDKLKDVEKKGASPTLLLLDGLDEISEPTDLIRQLQNLPKDLRVVITSRPHVLFQALERLENTIHISSMLRLGHMSYIDVDKLVEGRLILSKEKGWAFDDWDDARLKDLIKKVQRVTKDAKIYSPLLASFLCLIAEDPNNDVDKLVRGESALYDAVIEKLLKRGIEKLPEKEMKSLDTDVLKDISAVMAYIVHNWKEGETVGNDEACKCLKRIGGDTVEGLSWRDGPVEGRLDEMMRKHIQGLLSVDKASRYMVFLHMTIQEYLVARFLTGDGMLRTTGKLRDVIIKGYGNDLPPFSWAESVKKDRWDGVHRFAIAIKGSKWLANQEGLQDALCTLRTHQAHNYILKLGAEVAQLPGESFNMCVGMLDKEEWYLKASVALLLTPGQLDNASGFVDKLCCMSEDNDNPAVRFAASQALGRIEFCTADEDEQRVVSTTLTLLKDEHLLVRCTAAAALGDMGEAAASKEGVVEGLVGLLKDKDADARCSAAYALGNMGELAVSKEGVVEGMVGLLKDDNANVRGTAAHALGRMGEAAASKEGVQGLMGLLKHDDVDGRGAAAEALGNMGEAAASKEGVVEGLVGLLKDDHGWGRRAAAEALGKMGEAAASKEGVEGLMGLLKHDNEDVRGAAAEVLGLMGEAAASKEGVVEGLVGLLKDHEKYVRYGAADVLRNMGEAAASKEGVVEGLVGLLKHDDEDVRGAAAEVLGMMGEAAASKEGVVEGLMGLLKDDDVDVRRAAAEALGNMGEAATSKEGVVEGLVGLLKDHEKYVRYGAADVLRNMGEAAASKEGVVKGLVGLLKHDDEDVRGAAAEVLGMMREAAASKEGVVEGLMGLFKDDDPNVRRKAALALRKITSKQ